MAQDRNGTVSITLMVVGAILIAVGFGADAMNLGSEPGIGWKQTTLIVVGAILLVIGLVQRMRSKPS